MKQPTVVSIKRQSTALINSISLLFPPDKELRWKQSAISITRRNGSGQRSDQLHRPTDVIIDDIDCAHLAMHEDGTVYVSDSKKHEVKRWRREEAHLTIVAGGNGKGNQLNDPSFIFVDNDHSLYISDWNKDSKEGIVVAGGNGRGDRLTQLSSPQGVILDQYGQIYIADGWNARVIRWCEGEHEGTIVVGDNGQGQQPNQLNIPTGLSFDSKGNLYVADYENHRIQKFERDFD